MGDTFTIRHLGIDDRDAYFALRLEALEAHPHAFATSADEWRNAPPATITRLLQVSEDGKAPIVGAFTATGVLVGSVGLHREERAVVRHKASMVALYVAPQWRRQGVATLLIRETLARAREMPGLEMVRVVVDADTTNVRRLFEQAGFFVYGQEPRARRVQDQYYDQWYMLCFLQPQD